jgi:hypothetical protein
MKNLNNLSRAEKIAVIRELVRELIHRKRLSTTKQAKTTKPPAKPVRRVLNGSTVYTGANN